MSLVNEHITVQDGEACIRGTQVAVISVWTSLLSGATQEQSIERYSGVTEADIQAVMNLLVWFWKGSTCGPSRACLR